MSGALMLFCVFSMESALALGSAPSLSSDENPATAGFFRLSWNTDSGNVELQKGSHKAFRNPVTTYLGPDQATVISGKPDGTWYYRARVLRGSNKGPWSEPIAVTVRHHSLARALIFLSLGIVVFLATAWMVVRGSVKTE